MYSLLISSEVCDKGIPFLCTRVQQLCLSFMKYKAFRGNEILKELCMPQAWSFPRCDLRELKNHFVLS